MGSSLCGVMVSVLTSNEVYHGFIGGVMVSVFTSSVGDCGLISTVLLCRLWVDIYGFIV